MNLRCKLDDGRKIAVEVEARELLRGLFGGNALAAAEARFAKAVVDRAALAPMSRQELREWDQWAAEATT